MSLGLKAGRGGGEYEWLCGLLRLALFSWGWWFRLRLWDGASLLLLCEWQAKFEDVRETLWG